MKTDRLSRLSLFLLLPSSLMFMTEVVGVTGFFTSDDLKSELEAGNHTSFGSFSQSDRDGVEKDPISWRVLSNNSGEPIILSNKILYPCKFNNDIDSANDNNLRVVSMLMELPHHQIINRFTNMLLAKMSIKLFHSLRRNLSV